MTSKESVCPHCHESFDTPESLLQHVIDSPDCRPSQAEPVAPEPLPAAPEAPSPAAEPAPLPRAAPAGPAPISDEQAASLISKWIDARTAKPGAEAVGPEAGGLGSRRNVAYDPAVIQAFANALYAHANLTIALATGAGLLGGLGLGAFFGRGPAQGGWTLAGLLVGGLAGFFFGRGKAFAFKLQAQTALCQMTIELNTRKPSRAESP